MLAAVASRPQHRTRRDGEKIGLRGRRLNVAVPALVFFMSDRAAVLAATTEDQLFGLRCWLPSIGHSNQRCCRSEFEIKNYWYKSGIEKWFGRPRLGGAPSRPRDSTGSTTGRARLLRPLRRAAACLRW